MTSARCKPAIPSNKRLQTNASDRTATGIFRDAVCSGRLVPMFQRKMLFPSAEYPMLKRAGSETSAVPKDRKHF
jgi:hypothetical protein